MSCDRPLSVRRLGEGTQNAGPSVVPNADPERDGNVPAVDSEREPPAPAPGAGTRTAIVLAASLPDSRMSTAERLAAIIAQAGKQSAAALRKRSKKHALGAMIAHLLAAQPESVAAHQAHIHSRAWVPEGCGDAGWVKWVQRFRIAYHYTAGTILVTLGNSISATGARGRRFAAVTASAVIVAVLAAVFVF